MHIKVVLLLSVMTVGAAMLLAQGPGGPGGPGRGPGGFGFGPGPFPGMGGPMGMPQSGIALLGMPEVRTELKITEAQQKSIDELMTKVRDEMRSVMEGFRPFDLEDLTDEERQAKFDDLRKRQMRLTEDADESLDKILQKDQIARLEQLKLQNEGGTALSRSSVAEKLSLTDEQREKLKQIEADSQPRIDVPGPPDFGRREQERQKQLQEMLAVLNAAQKSQWDEMIGKPFSFPTPAFGPGGPGGPMGQERKLVKRFDKDGDHRLNREERAAARVSLKSERPAGGSRGPGPFGGGLFGPPGGPGGGPRRENREPPKPGPRASPDDVKSYPDAKLYDPTVLRTFFLDFENDDWEAELSDFNRSDVDVPATLTVDGQKYHDVGVHFRGMSSNMGVPQGYKHSLNLSLDHTDDKQRIDGYKTLNLLNCHEDPSCMSSVLYSTIARKHIPAPKANYVKVVINGETWGIYSNVQQFNKEFLKENFNTTKGSRWKVPGSPGGDGGLNYFGEKIEDYRRRYEIKSEDNDKAWNSLIALCRTLKHTPTEKLPEAIEPLVDIDGLLWFLALDVTLINNDGYWVRSSDYSIYLDPNGKFHFIPHDMNEAFHGAMMMGFGGPRGGQGPGDRRQPPPGGATKDGPPRRGGPGGGGPRGGGPGGGGGRGAGVELDPLVGMDDDRKPLRSKVLAVPEYRARYLQCVRTIAEESLDWKYLGPVVAQLRALISDELQADTKKLEPYEAFLRVTDDNPPVEPGRGRELPLRTFADQRRAYLLKYLEMKTSQR